MKSISLALIYCVLFCSPSIAQIPRKAFPLTNSLYKLWAKGKTEKAVSASLELYNTYPPFFIDKIHNTLAQQIQRSPKGHGQEYLAQLLLEENKEINKIIAPLYLWSKVLNSNTSEGLDEILVEMNTLLQDTAYYPARTERYLLLILQTLDDKGMLDRDDKEKILHQTIQKLASYPYLDTEVAGSAEGKKRAWYRYLLAFSNSYLFKLEPNVEAYLKNASYYSPDLGDKRYKHAYFYDANLLIPNTKTFDFHSDYQAFLTKNNRQSAALDLYSEITFSEPTDLHIKKLKTLYKQQKRTVPFSEYWWNYVHENGKPIPEISIEYESFTLDLREKPVNWIYIDVWGTWCKPCLKELPELQSFYLDNNEIENSKIKIYTFSYRSQNLEGFMSRKAYTFPVSEIDEEIVKLFDITGYPTKILISPEGNYINIPWGVDWRAYVKNYTLQDE